MSFLKGGIFAYFLRSVSIAFRVSPTPLEEKAPTVMAGALVVGLPAVKEPKRDL